MGTSSSLGLAILFAVSSCTALAGCSSDQTRGRIASPDGVEQFIHWDADEKEKAVAMRTLRKSKFASYHLVRATGDEKPHVHERSDLTVVIISGEVRAHVGEMDLALRAGDVVDIPKGTPHWIENAGPGPSEAFAIFAPAFDGKDRKFLKQDSDDDSAGEL